MMAELPDVERLQVVDIRPNDTIVLHLPERTTLEQGEELAARFRAKFPDQKVLVLGAGLEIEVHRAPPALTPKRPD